MSGVYYAVGRIWELGAFQGEDVHLLFWVADHLSPTSKVVHCGGDGEYDPASKVTSWNLGDVTCRTCARRAFDVLDDQIQAVERVFVGDDPRDPADAETRTWAQVSAGTVVVRSIPDPLASLSDESTTDDW